MGLLSEKNKEVLFCAGCNIKTGAGYCNGYFSNGCCGFCQRDHFTAA